MSYAIGRGVSRRALLSGLGAAALASLPASRSASAETLAAVGGRVEAPSAPRDGTSYALHGVTIADPYRPLEDPTRADVRAWVDALDAVARSALNGTPLHAQVAAFLRASGRYKRPEPLTWRGDRYFSLAFDGSSEQPRLEMRDRPSDPPRTLIDTGTLSVDGTTSLSSYYFDRTATKVAYLTADAGGDATVLRIRDVRTGLDLVDRLDGCRFTSVAWLPSGTGFYYARPPLPSEPAAWDRKSHMVFYHQLGYPQAADTRVFHFDGRQNVFMTLTASTTTNQLFISAKIGTSEKRGLWIAPIDNAALAIRVLPMGKFDFSLIRNVGPRLFAVTDHEAPRGRIVRLDLASPHPNDWKTIVPEGEGVIDGARILANRLIVRTFQDLGHRLTVHDLDGIKRHDVRLDDHTAVALGAVERQAPEIYVSTSSRRHPGRLHKLTITTGAMEPVAGQAAPPHDLADIALRYDSYAAPDGTRVPITLMYRRDAVFAGEARTLLYAYGGFGHAQWPQYNGLAAAWVRLGGVYAIAHVRGGGEYGQMWHDKGRARNRQVGIDDLHAAARWLMEAGVTRRERLGIYGASNGGMLVLAAMLQRTDLYGAVVAGVPVTDMFRFHHHTFGIGWKPEYGDPEVAEDFAALRTYSPLHSIKAGATYPPLLILTADNDQRVVPSHAYKFAATLRELAPASDVLVRTRRAAGHGAGNAYSKHIEYQADVITFLTTRLGGPLSELPKV